MSESFDTILPKELEKTDSGIRLLWSDGKEQLLSARFLRLVCPCATCREKRTAKAGTADAGSLPVISPAEAAPEAIVAMRPVGNYAYQITFADGHDTGIFSFEFLRSLEDRGETASQRS